MTVSSIVVRVALLGRPNVGKSTLFNRLIKSNRAITHDRPGITRDRMEGIVKRWGKPSFILFDTGGVTLEHAQKTGEGPDLLRGFEEEILLQAKEAIATSALLCLVVDARDGLTPFDSHLADLLRKSGKPILLIVNKVDGPEKADFLTADFHSLGLSLLPCSSAHGYNIAALEDAIYETIFTQKELDVAAESAPVSEKRRPRNKKYAKDVREDENIDAEEVLEDTFADATDFFAQDATEDLVADGAEFAREFEVIDESTSDDDDMDQDSIDLADVVIDDAHSDEVIVEETGPLRLALLGKPNAGKSSLVNSLVGETRMIVSDIPGTTRDSVDVHAVIGGQECTFVDTAGVRRPSKIADTVERYSVNSSLKSSSKAHVTLIVVSAGEGVTSQDKRLIDLMVERRAPFMLLINKCDLITSAKRKEVEKNYADILVFCPHVPLLFISALEHKNLKKIVPLALKIRQECFTRIGTGILNRSLQAVLQTHQPPMIKGVRPKFFYMTQAEIAPPTFVFFVSDAKRILPSYERYIEKGLRKLFGILYAPMRLHFRSSHKKRK